MDPTIANWTPAQLRQFIVNSVLSDPGSLPKPKPVDPTTYLPANHTDGDVPVWDQASQRWTTSGVKKIAYTALATGTFLRLATSGTDRVVSYGTAVATFTGVGIATSVNVAHGLGVTPQIVLTTPQQQSGLNAIPATEAGTYGATTFNGQTWTIDGQVPVNGSTVTFAWLAIG